MPVQGPYAAFLPQFPDEKNWARSLWGVGGELRQSCPRKQTWKSIVSAALVGGRALQTFRAPAVRARCGTRGSALTGPWGWTCCLSVLNRDPARGPASFPEARSSARWAAEGAPKPATVPGYRTQRPGRHSAAVPVKRAGLAGKTLPWPLLVTYLSRHALSGGASEYLNIRYEIAQELGCLYSGIFCWGGFWPSKGQKGNAFCWLCIVVSGEAFKYMGVLWYSKHAEIHSAFTKNPEVYRGRSPCCYHTALDGQQL